MRKRIVVMTGSAAIVVAMMLALWPAPAKAWFACNRAFYVQAGNQLEVERLAGDADQAYLAAYSHVNAATIDFEEAAKQDTLRNRDAELAAYDAGTQKIDKVIATLDTILEIEKQMIALLEKYGPEPGFEAALRSLDTEKTVAKLIDAKVVRNQPEVIAAMVEHVRKNGARGLISGRMEGIQKLRDLAVEWARVVREGRPVVAQGQLLAAIDGPGFPPTRASQQILRAFADNMAEDCPSYAYISKIARGTLGW